ncbi:sigma-70 family RNA polymerase sigma factor [Nonomuraea sp. NPDC002799]
MDERGWLAEGFEEHRPHLLGVAFRMLGSVHEADDAVQEAWLRLSGADTSGVQNLRGWLTTVTGRVCLDILRSRASRREEPLDWHMPDPIVSQIGGTDPEQEALLAESVGIALYVVLETLAPAERLAFVLHDVFAVPFEEIGTILGRTTSAVKQLASRARRRVQGASVVPDADLDRQHSVVDAFFAAARGGDFDALIALLDPKVTLRTDAGPLRSVSSAVIRGAVEVAGRALMFARPDARVHPALVSGAAGVVITVDHRPVSVMGFTVAGGRIVAIDGLSDPERLSALDLSAFVTD